MTKLLIKSVNAFSANSTAFHSWTNHSNLWDHMRKWTPWNSSSTMIATFFVSIAFGTTPRKCSEMFVRWYCTTSWLTTPSRSRNTSIQTLAGMQLPCSWGGPDCPRAPQSLLGNQAKSLDAPCWTSSVQWVTADDTFWIAWRYLPWQLQYTVTIITIGSLTEKLCLDCSHLSRFTTVHLLSDLHSYYVWEAPTGAL